MRAIHPDEATLLRSVLGELPEKRQADLKGHLARCHPCRKERDLTKRLHERLSGAGDSLAFSADDPFERRPACREVKAAGRLEVRTMAAALARLEGEKMRVRTAVEVDAIRAAIDLDLADAAVRLAAAHLLEEGTSGDSSKEFSAFAEALTKRVIETEPEVESVVPGALLRVLAHLVLGNWRLFTGRSEEAAAELSAAWAALGAFDAPEHLFAWVEVGESLRRSYEGRPVEARLLVERALETFERYGLGGGILRARHVRAVAFYTACEFREAHREFQAVLGSKEATRLDRARAVSGAAFCLAARGRFHEAAKEYSPVRRKLKGEGAMTEQYFLQGEMKVALGTAGRWHPRRDGLAAFALPELGGAFHGRETAVEIVKALSEEGLDKAKELLGKTEADLSRGYAYLYACQLASPKVQMNPPVFVEFARAIGDATPSLPLLKDKEPPQPVCREQVLGEAQLLKSNALNNLGRCAESRQVAQEARATFVEVGEDSLALAFVDYFEGSAASFEGNYMAAWKLLGKALSGFQLYGQENWTGRTDAALGTLLMNRNRNESAFHFFERALLRLHPFLDAAAHMQTLMNQAGSLLLVGELAAAKVTYAKALGLARRLNLRTAVLNVRYGLASIDLKQGHLLRALNSFQKVAESAKEQDLEQGVLIAELRVAECLGRLGHREEMLTRVRSLRCSREGLSVAFDPMVRDLFALADEDNVSSELVAHVVAYLDARDRGVRSLYRPFRLVANGS